MAGDGDHISAPRTGMPPPAPVTGVKQQDLRRQALMSTRLQPVAESGVQGGLVEGGLLATAARRSAPPDIQEQLGLQQACDMPRSGGRNITQRCWKDYWDDCQCVEVPGRGTFNVYTAGASGAVVLCLHGAGYTGLTWSLVAAALRGRYRVVAPDLRGHGKTSTADDADLSSETLTRDVVELWQSLFGDKPERTPVMLVGHSMGGALAVHAAATRELTGIEGVAVIDVVEGTALAALPHMLSVVRSRPAFFPSMPAALEWAVRSGACKCAEMAGVSLPSQLVEAPAPTAAGSNTCTAASGATGTVLTWRTPLEPSRLYWEGWYKGLSEAFLALPVPKMLLLAGTDRLDKVLTIGQMQGRFQLVLLPTAGHAIQEDEPGKTADSLLQFLHRFRIGEPAMVIPRAPPGVRPVLPLVAGPMHERAPPLQPPQQQ